MNGCNQCHQPRHKCTCRPDTDADYQKADSPAIPEGQSAAHPTASCATCEGMIVWIVEDEEWQHVRPGKHGHQITNAPLATQSYVAPQSQDLSLLIDEEISYLHKQFSSVGTVTHELSASLLRHSFERVVKAVPAPAPSVNREMLEALRKFGVHQGKCLANYLIAPGAEKPIYYPCTCGLTEAIQHTDLNESEARALLEQMKKSQDSTERGN